MTTAAFAPRNTEFQHSPDGVTYTTIAEIKKGANSGSKADTEDATNMDSGPYREFVSTLLDSGEITLDANMLPGNASQQILEADFGNQTLGYYKIVLPNALGNATFRAIVTSKDFDLAVDKLGSRSYKLKISGAVTTTW